MIVEAVLCLALNIYYEARSSPLAGQLAVGFSTLNRVKAPNYPNDVCSVVFQARYNKSSKHPIKHKCQYSWFCDGKSDKPKNEKAMIEATMLATHLLEGSAGLDFTEGATHYHASYIQAPSWASPKHMTKIVKIGNHIFYRKENTK